MGGRGRMEGNTDNGDAAARQRIQATYADIRRSRSLPKASTSTAASELSKMRSVLGRRKKR